MHKQLTGGGVTSTFFSCILPFDFCLDWRSRVEQTGITVQSSRCFHFISHFFFIFFLFEKRYDLDGILNCVVVDSSGNGTEFANRNREICNLVGQPSTCPNNNNHLFSPVR